MVAGVIGAVTTIGGALIGSSTADRNREAAQDGTAAQLALAREIYYDQRELQEPFYQAGVGALRAEQELLGLIPGQGENGENTQLNALRDSPGYQFRRQEGQNALETGAAARGGLLSGGHIRRSTRYAQDYASNEFNNYANQLRAVRGGGQVAASNTQQAAGQYGASADNALAIGTQSQIDSNNARGSIYGDALGAFGGIATRSLQGG